MARERREYNNYIELSTLLAKARHSIYFARQRELKELKVFPQQVYFMRIVQELGLRWTPLLGQ